jgi:mannose-6-phosphate isomerase-like protein (cupin superfamily)
MPARQFRVSPERYPSREVVHGITARAGRFYILRGRCRITYPDESVELAPGDVADLAEGTHSLEVLGDADLEAVAVWELPFAVRE